jgi:hypothetical protein
MTRKNLSLFPFLVLFIFLLTTFSFSQQTGSVERIVISKTEKTLEVKILLSLFSYYRHFELPKPNRVGIDLFDIRAIKAPSFLRVNALGVRGVRTGMYKPRIARVVFDMIDQTPPYKIETIQNGLRILFWPKEEPEEEPEEKPEEKPEEEPEEKPEEEKVIEEKIEVEIGDATCDMRIVPTRANLGEPIFLDMSGSRNAKSMEVEVFDKEGIKITSQELTPEYPNWQTKFDEPGEYFFKGRAFNTEDKPSGNLCEAKAYINFPPVSKLKCSPCKEQPRKPITLDATGSTDPDGEVIRIDFEITDEEGNLVDRFTDNEKPFSWEKIFDEEGKYTVTAICTDDYDAVSEPAMVDVVARKKGKERLFLFLDAGALAARGLGTYIVYPTARMGIVYEIIPGVIDITLSGGGAYTNAGAPWKSFFSANMLLNFHIGPVFIGAGYGVTANDKETLPESYGEAVANIGFDTFRIGKAKVSILFEGMGPINELSLEENYKVTAGLRFRF